MLNIFLINLIVMQEWFPLREQLLALSSGWLMFIAGILAVIYLWIKVCWFDAVNVVASFVHFSL